MIPELEFLDLARLPCALSPVHPEQARTQPAPGPGSLAPSSSVPTHSAVTGASGQYTRHGQRQRGLTKQMFWLSEKTLTLAFGHVERLSAMLSSGRGNKTDDSIPLNR